MPRGVDLLKQYRNEELWQMCCGFLSLDITEFMDIQKRLLLQQMELLNNCALGKRIMRGLKPQTVDEFRRQVPITTYKDYCPDLTEKKEDILPEKPSQWVRTSGRSGDYPFKWVPMTSDYAQELSKVLYGIGIISSANGWGDIDNSQDNIRILYSVAPRPYISGTFADLLRIQTPVTYLPSLEEAEGLPFEERIELGFDKAMSKGIDYFFGLSLVLVKVGEKICDSSNNTSIRPYLKSPKALWRLVRGKVKSRIAGRPMLPKDLWSLKGILGSGVDSIVYKDKIQELWGKRPLDLYSCTEGGIIATQTWDYDSMTFIPNLNFLEFIPEEEQLKLQMDRTYKPNTLLLDEVEAGKEYEIVITNFHGGAMTRYRIGDIVKITSLRNDELGINIPQMAFERRVDDVLYFVVVKLTEKQIWQAIESSGLAYEDWIAYKVPGEHIMHLLIEPKDDTNIDETQIATDIKKQVLEIGKSGYQASEVNEDWRDTIDFDIDVTLLPRNTFSRYTALRQSEGADLAHIKPPHINPPSSIISLLLAEVEDAIIVTKNKVNNTNETNIKEVIIT